MKKTIRTAFAGLLLVPVLALGVSAVAAVGDVSAQINLAPVNTGTPTDLNDVFKTIINVLLFIIGAVSVIMLIYGGIRYTTSGGNANSVTAAKNTIMYAVIGLIIAIFAFAIVNFVVDQLN